MNTTIPRKPYKYFTLLVIAFMTCYLTSTFILNRLIRIDDAYITGGTFIYFLTPLIGDIVAEVYGYRAARQLLWGAVFAGFFMACSISLCLRAPYPAFWAANDAAYTTVLEPIFRTVFLGTFAIILGQFTNIYLVSKWKIFLKGKYFWLRSIASSFIGDTLTVTLSIVLIFVGRIPGHDFALTLPPEIIIMILFSIIGAFPASLLAAFLKKAEGLDIYDNGVNFNPFKLALEN